MSDIYLVRCDDGLMTAQELGNPYDDRKLQVVPSESVQDIVTVMSTTHHDDTPRFGTTSFACNHNPAIFEHGCLVEVLYDWNDEIEHCYENDAIRDRTSLDIMFFRTKVLPQIDKPLPPMARFHLQTFKNRIALDPLEVPNKVYPSIPAALAIPRVPISLLRRVDHELPSDNVDLVILNFPDNNNINRLSVFKHASLTQSDWDPPDVYGTLLAELQQIVAICSPFILTPTFIVTDDTATLFRGFLTPFMPAGTLSNVFERIHSSETFLWTLCSKSGELQSRSQTSESTMIEDARSPPKLPWGIKHAWALETASAIDALHNSAHYFGDVKTGNILLDRSGHVQLIDIAPVDGYTVEYTAPELHQGETGRMIVPPQSAPRDIFALGLVMWQIASEISIFSRKDLDRSPTPLPWREDEGGMAIPNWFCRLVESCICEDPEKRPSARYVLRVLDAEFPKSRDGRKVGS